METGYALSFRCRRPVERLYPTSLCPLWAQTPYKGEVPNRFGNGHSSVTSSGSFLIASRLTSVPMFGSGYVGLGRKKASAEK